MNIEIDIIPRITESPNRTSIAASPIGQTGILVIMYVMTITTGVIVFNGNIIMCLTLHWLLIFSISQFVNTVIITLAVNFQYQSVC